MPGVSRRAGSWAILAIVLACLVGACRAAAPSTTIADPATPTTATTGTTALTSPSTSTGTGPQITSDGVVDPDAEDCHSFTVGLDRFVYNRLRPVVENAADLLHSPQEDADPSHVAESLAEASRQLAGLVEELDLMGIPPREIVDLLLSIREGTRLYAASFDKGARGWASGNQDLIGEAEAEVQEASAILTEMFGLQLCG